MKEPTGQAEPKQAHLPWADPRRVWDFSSTGHGDARWEDSFRMLNVRRLNAIAAPAASFDAAFSTED